MQIWLENLPLDIVWDEDALQALNWNCEVICDEGSLFKVELFSGAISSSKQSVMAEVYGAPINLDIDGMIKISKTIARFLKFHNPRIIFNDVILEKGLEVVFGDLTKETVITWEMIKELV